MSTIRVLLQLSRLPVFFSLLIHSYWYNNLSAYGALFRRKRISIKTTNPTPTTSRICRTKSRETLARCFGSPSDKWNSRQLMYLFGIHGGCVKQIQYACTYLIKTINKYTYRLTCMYVCACARRRRFNENRNCDVWKLLCALIRRLRNARNRRPIRVVSWVALFLFFSRLFPARYSISVSIWSCQCGIIGVRACVVCVLFWKTLVVEILS